MWTPPPPPADVGLPEAASVDACPALPSPSPLLPQLMWGALKQRLWMRSLRSLGFWAAMFALLLFFMIPVTFIQVCVCVECVCGGGFCRG